MTRRMSLAVAAAAGVIAQTLGIRGEELGPIDALVAAYPDHLAGHEEGWLLWRDGTRMPISDGIAEKSFENLIAHPDIDDIFTQPYVPGRPAAPPAENEDPGRFRNAELFLKMYGDCTKGEVDRHLVPVHWVDGHTLMVTSVNGVADRLQRVAGELARLPSSYRKFMMPSAGVYNCRTVAGTNTLSMHALAAAIDLNTAYGDYWRWDQDGEGAFSYRNRMPFEIVEIFERYGFIWGGKWYHYDTMHFSYRPELLLAAGQRPVGF